MKNIVWFCYASVTTDGHLKAASWIVAAARKLAVTGYRLSILTPAGSYSRTVTDDGCVVYGLPNGSSRKVSRRMTENIRVLLQQLQPDVFQIFGTEFFDYQCAGLAARQAGIADHTVVWLQGICAEVARCYCDGLPSGVVHSLTFRDLVRLDNIFLQQKKFTLRAKNEEKLLHLAAHVIGRTEWDRNCIRQIAPDITYHYCSETLRPPFYGAPWRQEECQQHRLFVCQSDYPIKGLHILLRAMPRILAAYPDTMLYIAGENPLEQTSFRQKLARQSYPVYLRKQIRGMGLERHIVFTGYQDMHQMARQYRSAHVYILPSMVENSPNSLGEAMALGVPCVAADCGGIPSMLEHGREGLLYEKTDANALVAAVTRLFDDPALALRLGENARKRAFATHDPDAAMRTLIRIYDVIGGNANASQQN